MPVIILGHESRGETGKSFGFMCLGVRTLDQGKVPVLLPSLVATGMYMTSKKCQPQERTTCEIWEWPGAVADF